MTIARPDDGAAAAEDLAAAASKILCGMPAAAPFLRDWPTCKATRVIPARALPVEAWLCQAREAASLSTAPFVEMLAARSNLLAWSQTYAEADVGAAFLDRYGWTELIGSRGPIPSETIAAGVLVLGPETHYPAHAHAAEELYLPLTGPTAWRFDGGPFIERMAGEPIHHPPWIPHAMRTGSIALVALYVWIGGDLAAKSRMVSR